MAEHKKAPTSEPSFIKERGGAVVVAALGCLLIADGIRMYLTGYVSIGTDPRTLQPKVVSGPFVGFLGGLLVYFAWHIWQKPKE